MLSSEGIVTRLWPRQYWRQLALIVSASLVTISLGYGWYSVNYISGHLADSAEKELLALARNIELSVAPPLLAFDYILVQDVMLSSAEYPGIRSVEIVLPNKQSVGRAIRGPDSLFRLDLSKRPLPSEISTDDKVEMLVYPLEAAGRLGTLYIERSRSEWLEMRDHIRLVTFFSTLLMLVSTIALLMLLIRRSSRALDQATAFAGTLADSAGHTVEVPRSSVEFERLGEALNSASLRLSTQQQAIKTASDRLRAILQNAADAIITIDENDVIESFNAAAEILFGYKASEMVGRTLSGLLPDSFFEMQRSQFEKGAAMVRVASSQAKGSEIVARRKDGSEFLAEASVSKAIENGNYFFTIFLRDVSERVRIIRDLVAARNEAEKANQAKSAFLATMSHEIRTPMNGVIGMVDLLQQCSLQQQHMEMVDVIKQSAFSLLAIIDDILDLSKIEAGKLEIERAPMSVFSVAERVCDMLDRFAVGKGVELTLFTDPNLPEEVLGDETRVRQVFTNLVNNAIKFTSGLEHPGCVSIRLVLLERDMMNAMVELQVVDNGIGMDEATLGRLFTSFTQADASTTRRFGGTGLGLAVSRHLIDMMGGTIQVRSVLGGGSTFTVRLPFRAEATTASGSRYSDLRGLNCLVVSEPVSMGGDLSKYLTYNEVKVNVELDFVAACERISTGHNLPDFVIIDAGKTTPALNALALACRNVPTLIVRRGLRRYERVEHDGIVSVDGNAMHRKTFIRAVALAVGREFPAEIATIGANKKVNRALLSREEALKQRCLILIAEDNETNQKVIRQQLAMIGYVADIANDGLEAMQRWVSGDYALLLTDISMPRMDGYQLAASVRAAEINRSRVPIIACTANALKGEAERCFAVGMDDFITKPIQTAQLKALLDKWLPLGEFELNSFAVQPVPVAASLAAPQVAVAAAAAAAVQEDIHSKKAVDVKVLQELVGDEPAVIKEFLEVFRVGTAKTAEDLRDAAITGEILAVGNAAHKLKSSARTVGALGLGDLCEELELAAKSGKTEALITLMPKFEAEIAAVNAYLCTL